MIGLESAPLRLSKAQELEFYIPPHFFPQSQLRPSIAASNGSWSRPLSSPALPSLSPLASSPPSLRRRVPSPISIRMSSGDPPRPLRILATAAGYFFGGLFTLSLASSVAMRSMQSFMEAKRKKVAPPCASCKGKGFYGCKLCKGKSTIEWSPLYDPIVINPCLCPTCEGNKIQRCLNCLGKGYV